MASVDSKVTEQRVFKPYQWQHELTNQIEVPGHVLMDFAEKVHSIASGSSTILQIAEANSLDGELRDEGDPLPFFRPYDIASMLKLVQTSIDLLNTEAERLKDWAYEHRTKQGAIDRYEQAAYGLKAKGIPLPTGI